MRNANYLLILICCYFITGCKFEKIDKNSDCEYYQVNITNELLTNDFELTSLFKSHKIIKLDAGIDEYIDYFDALKILNDTIYIMDRFNNKSIYIFTIEGHYVNKICKIGKGPGEYIQLADFDIDRETGNVLILDWDKGEVINYDVSGNYISTLKLGNRYSSFAKHYDNYLMSNHFSMNKEELLLNFYNNKGKLFSSFFSALNYQNCSSLLFRYGGNFFFYSDEYRYFIPETDTVYRITTNQISPYLVLEHPVSSKEKGEVRPVIYSYSENDSYVFFKTEINSIPYDIFFNKNTKETTPISIFNLEEKHTGLPIEILGITDNYLFALVNKNSMGYIQTLISNEKINDDEVKSFVESYGAFNLLICYEFN